MIDKNNCSIITLGFYVYLFAGICSFMNYSFMFIKFQDNPDAFIDHSEGYDHYLEWHYFRNIFRILAIFITYVISECFSFTVLMYFVKNANISKATLFGALHGLFVVALKYIFDTEGVSHVNTYFMICIVIGYIMIFQDKRTAARGKKKQAAKIYFKRKLSVVTQTGALFAETKLKIDGKCFYETDTVSNINPMLNRRMTELRSNNVNKDNPYFALEDKKSNEVQNRPVNTYWKTRAARNDLEEEDVEILDSNQNPNYLDQKYATDLQILEANMGRRSGLKDQPKEGFKSHITINESYVRDSEDLKKEETQRLLDDED